MRYRSSVQWILLVLAVSWGHCLARVDDGADQTAGNAAELREYFRAETERIANACLSDIETLADWEAKRPLYRRQLFEMMGLDPLPPKTDLKAEVTGRIENEEIVVEKVHFQSRPGLYVTGNLYRPRNQSGPAPAVLYVCGHGAVKKDGVSFGNKVHYQHHAIWLARNGYVCLTIDTLQLGEIEGLHHGTYKLGMWWWNSRGYTPAGVEAWNCIRALDYLETRPEVDAKRIGVTGRSGGGAYSWWIAALDDRIRVAIPVAGITDLRNHVIDGCVEGHCDCMYFVNTFRWDYPLVAALVAPRPLLITNTDRDPIFPLDGVQRTHHLASKIYDLYGAAENLGLQISPGDHADTQELQVAAFRWFDRFLKDDTTSLAERTGEKLFQPEQLKVFAELPGDQANTTIQESFTEIAKSCEPPASENEWRGMKAAWREALAIKVFSGWPTVAEPPTIEVVSELTHGDVLLTEYRLSSQDHVYLPLLVVSLAGEIPQSAELRVLDDDEWRANSAEIESGFASGQLAERLAAENVALAYLAPRGIGPADWGGDERTRTQIERRFDLLGQTLDGMRVWDIRRAVQALEILHGELIGNAPARSDGQFTISLHGTGNLGIDALYAAIHEPAVTKVVLANPPNSHCEGPTYLNVQRYMDIPQAIALAAEHARVKIVGGQDSVVEFAQKTGENLGWPVDRLAKSP